MNTEVMIPLTVTQMPKLARQPAKNLTNIADVQISPKTATMPNEIKKD